MDKVKSGMNSAFSAGLGKVSENGGARRILNDEERGQSSVVW